MAMAKLQLKRELLDKAQTRRPLRRGEARAGRDRRSRRRQGGHHGRGQPPPARAAPRLLDDSRLTPNQRTAVAVHIYGMSDAQRFDRELVYSATVSDPIEFGSMFVLLGGRSPNCEVFLNGRWYPITLGVEFLQDKEHLTRAVVLRQHFRFASRPTS